MKYWPQAITRNQSVIPTIPRYRARGIFMRIVDFALKSDVRAVVFNVMDITLDTADASWQPETHPTAAQQVRSQE